MKIVISESQLNNIILKEGYREINELRDLSYEVATKLYDKISETILSSLQYAKLFEAVRFNQPPRIKYKLSSLVENIGRYEILNDFIINGSVKILVTNVYRNVFGTYDSGDKLITITLNQKRLNDHLYVKLKSNNFVLDEEINKEIGRILINVWTDTLIHEIQHGYDDYRSKGNYANNPATRKYREDKSKPEEEDDTLYKMNKEKLFGDYLALPHEYWARFSQYVSHQDIPHMKFPDVLNDFRMNFSGYDRIDEKGRKRLEKSLYKYWDSGDFIMDFEKLLKSMK